MTGAVPGDGLRVDRSVATVAGAVLCGGASRRMGSPKPLVPWDGVAMARRVADALSAGGCSSVRCVGGDPAVLAAIGLEVVADRWPGEGPLGGVLTALLDGADDAVLVAPCDTPLLLAATVSELVDRWRSGRADVVVARTDRVQPLCAVWDRAATASVSAAFAAGERSIRRLLPGLRVDEVAVEEVELRNVNTPADLAD
jgi:molybdopterin-guanine dinucleotide biosynthesis protein A